MPHKIKYFISDKNKKAINKYIKSRIADGKDNERTNELLENTIRKVLSLIDKDFNNITPEDLDNVFSKYKSSSTRETNKSYFKDFLKYYGFNDLANHININFKFLKESPYSDDDILTQDEINKIRDSNLDIRNKAIFELFITTGIRRGEFIILKYQNVERLSDRTKIHITKGGTKGKKRVFSIIPYSSNPCAFYPTNFISYFDNHIFKNQPDKPLFYSIASNTKYKKLNPISLTLFFKKVQEIAGIKKKITPHILRHTCATYYGYDLTPEQLRMRFGWEKSSDMPNRYCHINDNGIDDILLRKAGVTKETTENAICPFCQTINNINDKHCKNCKNTIDLKTIHEEKEKYKNLSNLKIKKLLREQDEMKKQIHLLLNGYVSMVANFMHFGEGKELNKYSGKKMQEILDTFEDSNIDDNILKLIKKADKDLDLANKKEMEKIDKKIEKEKQK